MLHIYFVHQAYGLHDHSMEELRTAGQVRGGPPPLNQQDRQAFANVLDRLLAKHRKS